MSIYTRITRTFVQCGACHKNVSTKRYLDIRTVTSKCCILRHLSLRAPFTNKICTVRNVLILDKCQVKIFTLSEMQKLFTPQRVNMDTFQSKISKLCHVPMWKRFTRIFVQFEKCKLRNIADFFTLCHVLMWTHDGVIRLHLYMCSKIFILAWQEFLYSLPFVILGICLETCGALCAAGLRNGRSTQDYFM